MSDHDAAPDPIDEAYVQAEAMLSDEDARAARRARVLAAVAHEPAATPAVSSRRRPAWGGGGWLAVACVIALSLFVTAQIYQPTPFQPKATPRATTAPASAAPLPEAPTHPAGTPAARRIVASAGTPAPAPSPAPASAALAAAPPAEKSAAAAASSEVSRGELAPIAPPPPPAPIEAPAPRAFPAAAVPAAPANVAAERPAPPPAANYAESPSAGASDEAVEGRSRDAARRASTLTIAGPPAAELGGLRSSGGPPTDPAARLRAAAAAGRTSEVETLLDQGAPVDAPDAAGDTALMKSVQADQPGAAAALRRHGASLDHKNRAGKSARDIATAKGDPDLDQAVGLVR